MDVKKQLELTLKASRSLALLSEDKINEILIDLADAALEYTEDVLVENQKDLSRMDPQDPKFDRLKLTSERIEGIAADIRNAKIRSPSIQPGTEKQPV